MMDLNNFLTMVIGNIFAFLLIYLHSGIDMVIFFFAFETVLIISLLILSVIINELSEEVYNDEE